MPASLVRNGWCTGWSNSLRPSIRDEPRGRSEQGSENTCSGFVELLLTAYLCAGRVAGGAHHREGKCSTHWWGALANNHV